MRPCVSGNISRASSRIFPDTPIRACLMAGRKGTNDKKSAVGGKKSPANAGTKNDYLIFIGSCQIDGMLTSRLMVFRSLHSLVGRLSNHALFL